MKRVVFCLLAVALVPLWLGGCGSTATASLGPTETPLTTLLPTTVVSPTVVRASATPAAPTLTPLPTATVPPTAAPSATPTTTPRPIAEHRISTRVVSGAAAFFDRETGGPFVPRGSNYIRLGQAGPDCQEPGTFYHSTFNPGYYDEQRAADALGAMHALGFNTVRVFVSQLCVARADGTLSSDYVRNLANFLGLARSSGVYVLLTLDDVPGPGYMARLPYYANIDWSNRPFMTREGIATEGRFWQDLIRALNGAGAPLEQVFGYELRNEMFYLADQLPLSSTTGVVTTGNGRSYDLADPQARQQMMDDNLVNWIDGVRAAILEVDPTALVGVGFFQPQGPNPSRIGDKRVVRTYPALWQSAADFVDLHAYPGVELTLAQYTENFELDDLVAKPVIMGEFGAFKSAYISASAAAQALQAWQVDSCRYGFDGWLLWTWDSDEQTELWNGASDGGVINQALAPASRPNPCKTGTFPGQNVALGKAATASRSLPSNPPAMAVDGLASNWWGAGDFAPQWLEIDLGAPVTIAQIRLSIGQSPDGQTVHRVWGRTPDGAEHLLHEFSGVTGDQQVLEFAPDSPWQGIRYLRIETVSSPSWVSWREVEVLSAAP